MIEAEYAGSEYTEYLRSYAWARKRRLVLERCGDVCERCCNARATTVHHVTYDRFGNERLDDLEGQCADCHGAQHDRGPIGHQVPLDIPIEQRVMLKRSRNERRLAAQQIVIPVPTKRRRPAGETGT